MATHPWWTPYASSATEPRQSERIAHRQVQPGPLQAHRIGWASEYHGVRQLIEDALPGGSGTVRRGQHAAAGGDGSTRYDDAKSAVVYEIDERAFLADPSHLHDPHPRA